MDDFLLVTLLVRESVVCFVLLVVWVISTLFSS